MTGSTAQSAIGHPVDLGIPEQVYRQGNLLTDLGARVLVWLLVMMPCLFVTLVMLAATSSDSDPIRGLILLAILIALMAYFSVPVLKKLRLYWSQRNDLAVLYPEGLAYLRDGTWSQARWSEITEVDIAREYWQWPDTTWSSSIFDDVLDSVLAYLKGDTVNYAITTEAGERIRLGETLTGIDNLMIIIEDRTRSFLRARKRPVMDFAKAT